jgi:hypothetical protein
MMRATALNLLPLVDVDHGRHPPLTIPLVVCRVIAEDARLLERREPRQKVSAPSDVEE